jgi:hypothetical protein
VPSDLLVLHSRVSLPMAFCSSFDSIGFSHSGTHFVLPSHLFYATAMMYRLLMAGATDQASWLMP